MNQIGMALTVEYDPKQVAGTDSDTDSYCSPPNVLEPVHRVAPVVALDPWTNGHAIAHGWVRAVVAWTLASGRDPDIEKDPQPWPIQEGDFVWGNPPYSDPGPSNRRFIHELKAAGAWGMLLLKTDNRTSWWAEVEEASPFLIMWKGTISFYLGGVKQRGNNFASTLAVVDYTGTPAWLRHDQLKEAFEGRPATDDEPERPRLAWVHR